MAVTDAEHARPVRLADDQPLWLGALHVLPATRQVVREGVSETLEPRIMQVLVALAHANGAVVSRDELFARCWEGRIVGDNAVHRAIAKLRDLGAKFGGGAFHIETIAKVGYRMIAAQVSSGSSLHAQFEPQPAPLHLRPHRRALALSVGALAIGGGGEPCGLLAPIRSVLGSAGSSRKVKT
jgi:DNA-binding winged helix-turn-helix (wHTH) protein